MKDKKDRLILCAIGLLFDILLMFAEEFWMQLYISRLVYSVDISESGGDGEVGADFRQGLVDVIDVLRLSVQGIVVNFLIVDAVLFATGYSDLLRTS